MSAELSDMAPAAPLPPEASASLPWNRVFYWSVRRELWERRSVFVAPLVVVGVILVGCVLSTIQLPKQIQAAAALPAGQQLASMMGPYSALALGGLATGFVVSLIYCIGALQGERRDRSILFWKSLPVSDRTTVLAKAAVPIMVVPVVVFGIIVCAQLVMLFWSTLVVAANGLDVSVLWSNVTLPFMWLVLAMGIAFMALWHAPLFAWLLLVSAWARRMAFLWAVLPLVVMFALEHVAAGQPGAGRFNTRVFGGFAQPFSVDGQGRTPVGGLADLDPLRLATHPGLWLGLAVAALFLFLAIRVRRSRGPI